MKEKALEKVQPMDTPFRRFHADDRLLAFLGIDLTTLTEGRETMRPDFHLSQQVNKHFATRRDLSIRTRNIRTPRTIRLKTPMLNQIATFVAN
jgi:hypothetical protein